MVSLGIFTQNNQKLADLYNSDVYSEGQAYGITYAQQIDGWKEQTFSLPRTVEGGLANYRWDYVKSEYRVRYEDGDETEWFIINAPKRARNGATLSCTVSCQHISSLLKTKRLYAVFDDTNGIGTAQDLLDKILSGTGWTRGLTSTFYEKDGTTEKIRSLLSEGKVGAYELIQQLCELFGAVPVFHGNEKTVDLLVKGDRTGMIELTPNKNMPSLVKTEDGSNIVTRLYVEGAYDDTGYLGIESVNPTGLTFILNFDYYKEIGLYTEDHEAATHQYLEDLKSCNDRLYAATAELQKKLTELNAIWGQCNYIVYDGGQLEGTTYTTDATPIASSQGDTIQDGDIVVQLLADGTQLYTTAQNVTITGNTLSVTVANAPQIADYILVYKTPASATLGGLEVAVEAKQQMIERLTEQYNTATSDAMKESYQQQLQQLQSETDTLLQEIYPTTRRAVDLAIQVKDQNGVVGTQQSEQANIEAVFGEAMGDMLRDGYWSDSTYIEGQEEALYADAQEMSQSLSRPQVSYEISFMDLAACVPGFEAEATHVNMAAHIIDEELKVNDMAYISSITKTPDVPENSTAVFETGDVTIAGRTFDSLFSRMEQLSNTQNEKSGIYDRAKAFTKDGKLSTNALDGQINVEKNTLLSSKGNWYTDDNGSLIFTAQDGMSAMMLTGEGFMIADGRDEAGDWNWRTIGTGRGFTADMFIAGEIQTALLKIMGTDRFMWDSDNIYIFSTEDQNEQIRIGRYDGEHYGIAFTRDGGVTFHQVIDHNGVTSEATGLATHSELEEMGRALSFRVTSAEQAISELNQSADKIQMIFRKLGLDGEEVENSVSFGHDGASVASSESDTSSTLSAGGLKIFGQGGTVKGGLYVTEDGRVLLDATDMTIAVTKEDGTTVEVTASKLADLLA